MASQFGEFCKKVWKYGCLLRRNFCNNANFTKPIRSIMHVGVLYLLAQILTFRSICPFSFRDFFILVTSVVKYFRDFKLLKESSVEQSCENRLSVGDLVSKIRRLDTSLSNKLVVRTDLLKDVHAKSF